MTNPGGETITAKVVDWSMKSIRFEIPKELDGTYGTYVIKVENGVGDTLRFVYVDSGMPGDMQDYAYIGDKSHKCAAGTSFNGSFYVFYSIPDCVFCTNSNRIIAKKITYGGYGYEISVSEKYSSIPDGTTDATVVPMVIGDKLWVFCTGQNGNLYYWRWNETAHDSKWNRISDVTTDHDWACRRGDRFRQGCQAERHLGRHRDLVFEVGEADSSAIEHLSLSDQEQGSAWGGARIDIDDHLLNRVYDGISGRTSWAPLSMSVE